MSTMRAPTLGVMAGHSRPKDGVASLAYDPAIHVFIQSKKDVDARDKRGHDGDAFGGHRP
jgi:hypothetical protein